MRNSEIIMLLSLALDVAEKTGVNVSRLIALRRQAAAENRKITADELRELSDSAQEAIDRLNGDT